jgi:predicted nucleic acid-binding protein
VKVVVDASVAIKWVIRDPSIEPDVDKATAILRGIRDRTIDAVEPPHWRAEIVSVIARERPQRVALMLGILATLPFTERAPIGCYRRAADISIELRHHLFDTLYHAVALEEGATLVTADEAYYGKAKDLGNITRLADFAI